MGTFLDSLKTKLITKLLTSLIPKYGVKYEADIKRAVLAINTLIAFCHQALHFVPDAVEMRAEENLNYVKKQWDSLLELVGKYLKIDLKEYRA